MSKSSGNTRINNSRSHIKSVSSINKKQIDLNSRVFAAREAYEKDYSEKNISTLHSAQKEALDNFVNKYHAQTVKKIRNGYEFYDNDFKLPVTVKAEIIDDIQWREKKVVEYGYENSPFPKYYTVTSPDHYMKPTFVVNWKGKSETYDSLVAVEKYLADKGYRARF